MVRNGTNKISVFDYNDYRSFLKDWHDEEKRTNPVFSYRAFSKRAGFNTSNFFMLVMNCKRNLTEESVAKFIVGLRLNKQEGDFFRNLVFFNQSKLHEEKNRYYQNLLQSYKYKQLKPIESKQYEYYSEWYHPVIRELIVSKEFDGTFEWLAEKISPSISISQAQKSVELLEKLGFIEKTGNNKWKQTSSIVSTGPMLKSVVVHNYHKSLLNLSLEIMEKLDMKHRDVSAVTLGIKKDKLDLIIQKIRDFRKEIVKLASSDDEPEEVAQLNIQFYPLTKVKEKEVV